VQYLELTAWIGSNPRIQWPSLRGTSAYMSRKVYPVCCGLQSFPCSQRGISAGRESPRPERGLSRMKRSRPYGKIACTPVSRVGRMWGGWRIITSKNEKEILYPHRQLSKRVEDRRTRPSPKTRIATLEVWGGNYDAFKQLGTRKIDRQGRGIYA